MSGGHFDYDQFKIDDIRDAIKELINKNNVKDEYGYSNDFSEETLLMFEKAVYHLSIAAVFSQRIDWLVCGDDDEESFHRRLLGDFKENGLDTDILKEV